MAAPIPVLSDGVVLLRPPREEDLPDVVATSKGGLLPLVPLLGGSGELTLGGIVGGSGFGITKAGAGSLSIGDTPMQLKDAKPLPSSD